MKNLILIVFASLSISVYSQDTTEFSIKPNWVNPEEQVVKDSIMVPELKLESKSSVIADVIEKITPNWVKPETFFEPLKKEEELTEEDVKALEEDVKFMTNLPPTYENLPKEDLKNALVQIDNKITQLKEEIARLIEQRAKQEVIKSKQGTLTVLEKEKNIINLTLTGGELKDENGNLIGQNDELKIEQDKLKKYLYTAIALVAVLGLIVAVVLQRKRIQVQDVEIDKQLKDISDKNTYLEYAARLIRHDMHSGINTYIPRGLSSLEKRIDADKMNELKIESSIKMIKEGLNHTQKVYKSVYEFTNLVKEQVVLEKQKLNLKETLDKFVAKTAYSDKVTIDELIDSDVNAIDNIVKNGIKYNKSDDKKVKIYMDNEFLVVEDNGVGLTQEEFNKILDPKYERVNKDSDGLGIKISNAILQEHGFNIYCEKIENGTKIKIKIK